MPTNKGGDNQKPQGDIAAKNAFSKWVYRLEGQIIALEEGITNGDVQRIKRQLETYKSEVQQLHYHADKNDIDISAYGTHFANIYQHIHSLEEKLKQRAQRQAQFPLYNLLRVIGSIASIVVSFFNPFLANAIDRATLLLPGERGPRTWLLPEKAVSLQDQSYKPDSLLPHPFKLPPPERRPSPPPQPPVFRPLQVNQFPPASRPPAPIKNSASINTFTSMVPCKVCGAKLTRYAPLLFNSISGYYCIKHFPRK